MDETCAFLWKRVRCCNQDGLALFRGISPNLDIFRLLLVGFSLFFGFIGNTSATTLDIPDTYSTIQAAINAANPGDPINYTGLPVPHPGPSGRYVEELSTLDTNSGVELLGLVRGDALSLTSDINHSFTSSMVSITAEGTPVHNLDTNLSYSTIQAAIDDGNTSDGHTIQVDAGTYYENVVVNKQLNIIGAGASNTIVNASNANTHVFDITADNVNISGFTVTGAPSSMGILLNNVANCNISNNIVLNNHQGIYLDSSTNNCIIGNNTASSNDNYGITLVNSYNNTISDNNASYNDIGILLHSSSNNNAIIDNNANSNNYNYGSFNYGIYLLSSSSNTIANNTANSNNDRGIYLFSSSSNTITNNNANSNLNFGIYLNSSSYNTI